MRNNFLSGRKKQDDRDYETNSNILEKSIQTFKNNLYKNI